MSVKIITDSASDIMDNNAENLTVIPMKISFGDDDYLDGVTISHKQFYEKLIETDDLPKTSLINPYSFTQAIDDAKQDGGEVVIITVSSKLSGTYGSAVMAAQDYQDVYVVDSENVCVGEKILVEYAIGLASSGMKAKDIVEKLEQKKKSICPIALLNTLEYLKKGGRIDFTMPIAIAYSGFDDKVLEKYIKDSEHIWRNWADSLPIGTLGATIGAHAGPGAIAVAFFSKK